MNVLIYMLVGQSPYVFIFFPSTQHQIKLNILWVRQKISTPRKTCISRIIKQKTITISNQCIQSIFMFLVTCVYRMSSFENRFMIVRVVWCLEQPVCNVYLLIIVLEHCLWVGVVSEGNYLWACGANQQEVTTSRITLINKLSVKETIKHMGFHNISSDRL